MRRIYTCFPGGRFKALTLSYDDGKITDRRLVEIFNENGLRATFHLNSELLGEVENHRFPYISSEEVEKLYEGHEVACHTCTHPTLTRIPEISILQEVVEDRKNLEQLTAYPVVGMSYPNGCYDERIKSAMRQCGICYSRTTKDTGRFDLPEDFLEWNPTCRHREHLLELAEKFMETEYDQRLMLFYVWGHSYEFELEQNWDLMETFAERVGGCDEIWYATNIEIYDYMMAVSQLRYFGDESGVYNPTGQDVWIKVEDTVYEIPAGKQIFFQGDRKPAYYLTEKRDILYCPCASGEGKLDDALVKYRLSRPAKTSGNPYHFMGEPIGDLRDNMYPQAEKIAQDVLCTERTVGGVSIRMYETADRPKDSACLVFVHGGSFIGGSMDVVEESCRFLSRKAEALVISVDYRLAPEHPFPEGIEDCRTAITGIYEEHQILFDRKKLYLGGDSAGGNLILASVQDEEVRSKTAGLLLLYPVTDLTGNTQFWKWKEEMYRGGKDGMEQHCVSSLKGFETLVKKLYVQDENMENPLISPIYMEVDADFPRTLLMTAEYDYLRKQGEAFGNKLRKAGVDVTMIRYGGMCHAFFDLLGKTSQVERCIEDMADFMK